MFKAIKITLFTLLVAAVLTSSFGAGYVVATTGGAGAPLSALQTPSRVQSAVPLEAPKQFRLLDEVWKILVQDFVEPDALDPNTLGRGAIHGLLTALGDSHTTYIDADDYNAERSDIRGSYEGIGAHVMMVEGVLTIVAPLPGSPAEQAGLRSGDRVLEVDGVSTQGMSLTAAVTKVKGPRGTDVTLVILRQGESVTRTIKITRDEIKTTTVIWQMLPDGLAHLRISQFSQRTGQEVQDALKEINEQGAKGIILDVRNNPGGLLSTTVEVVGQFLEGGIAGYQVDRSGNKRELPIRNSGEVTELPTVVLVNQGSASGSELLAGALQDRERAVVIGTQTFGKGSVNHLRELSDGSALYVTIGRWLTPSGRVIEGNGLIPDVELALTEADIQARHDAQLERAVQELKSRTP